MKVVLDSNIFISAFLRGALSEEIVRLCERGTINNYISQEIIGEITTKLNQKFKAKDRNIKDFFSLVNSFSKMINPKGKITSILDDPEDNKILECALEAKADLIITLDHHLLKLKKFEGVAIIHPKTLTWMIPNY